MLAMRRLETIGTGEQRTTLTAFAPADMLALARDAGLRDPQHVPIANLTERYFTDRPTGCGHQAEKTY